MIRFSTVLWVMPCLVIMGMWTFTATMPAWIGMGGSEGLSRDESLAAKLERRLVGRRLFALYMDPALEELGLGKTTLRQTAEGLIEHGRLYHMEYLFHVSWVEQGATLMEKVARNCLRHFDLEQESPTPRCERIAVRPKLDAELARIIEEERSGAVR